MRYSYLEQNTSSNSASIPHGTSRHNDPVHPDHFGPAHHDDLTAIETATLWHLKPILYESTLKIRHKQYQIASTGMSEQKPWISFTNSKGCTKEIYKHISWAYIYIYAYQHTSNFSLHLQPITGFSAKLSSQRMDGTSSLWRSGGRLWWCSMVLAAADSKYCSMISPLGNVVLFFYKSQKLLQRSKLLLTSWLWLFFENCDKIRWRNRKRICISYPMPLCLPWSLGFELSLDTKLETTRRSKPNVFAYGKTRLYP